MQTTTVSILLARNLFICHITPVTRIGLSFFVFRLPLLWVVSLQCCHIPADSLLFVLYVFKGCNLNQSMPFPSPECWCETYLGLLVCVCSMFLTNVLFLDLFKAQIHEYDILSYKLSWRFFLSALNFSLVSIPPFFSPINKAVISRRLFCIRCCM